MDDANKSAILTVKFSFDFEDEPVSIREFDLIQVQLNELLELMIHDNFEE